MAPGCGRVELGRCHLGLSKAISRSSAAPSQDGTSSSQDGSWARCQVHWGGLGEMVSHPVFEELIRSKSLKTYCYAEQATGRSRCETASARKRTRVDGGWYIVVRVSERIRVECYNLVLRPAQKLCSVVCTFQGFVLLETWLTILCLSTKFCFLFLNAGHDGHCLARPFPLVTAD